EHFETVHGGWFYYASGLQRPLAPSASFVNAAALVALDRARSLGITMEDRVLQRAIRATADQRKPDSSYLYNLSSPLDLAEAMAPDPPTRRQPRALAGLQPGPAALGRRTDHGPGPQRLARPPHHPQWLARHGPQAADPARVVRPGRGLLLLFRSLLRGPLHRP